jgi:hypothetical protein
MKIKKHFLAVFLGITLTACGQDQIDFANEFKPESEYIVTTNTDSKTEVKFEGSEEFINHLKSKGIDNPQITEESSVMKIAYITENSNDGVIPIEIKYIETGMPQDGFIRNGESLKGIYSSKDKIKITQLPDTGRIEMEANQLMTMMSDGFSIDLFNNGKLSVGDSVIVTSPWNIPLGPYQINIEIVNTYVLKSIKSNNANFNIISTLILKSDYPEIKLSASGGGSGNCVYNSEQRRVLSKTSDLKLIMIAEIQDGVKINMIQEMSTKETTEIK